ncbi:MAG: RimK family alpha-L-glutamate ligase [Desulfatiglandales bacterium]
MRLAIISAKSGLFHPNKRLLEASKGSNVEAFLLHPKGLLTSQDRVISYRDRGLHLDVALIRIGATINPYAMAVVRAMESSGVRVISRPEAIELARHKFLSLSWLHKGGIRVPESYLVSNKKNLGCALRRLGGPPVVLKATSGRQGEGVWLLNEISEMEELIYDQQAHKSGIVAQEYIDGREVENLRLFVVGGRVIGGLRFIPKRGEFRANFHMGAKAFPVSPDKELESIALKTSHILGLEIAGVDMVLSDGVPYVLEANYSPGFRAFEEVTGIDVAKCIIEYIKESHGVRS